MDDLIADFVAECREMLEALGGEIVAWEAEPDDRARLDSIFRFVHTVKGNCGFFEFPRLEALSHAAEDALADVRAGRRHADGPMVSAVLAIIDRIGEMIATIEAGEELPAGDDSALIELSSRERRAPRAGRDRRRRAGQGGAAPRTIRFSVELLDRVMSTVSDMVLARNELAAGCANRRTTCRSTARSSVCRPSSPRCATRSPGPACSGSKICSSPFRAWSATCPPSSASRYSSTSRAATLSSTAR